MPNFSAQTEELLEAYLTTGWDLVSNENLAGMPAMTRMQQSGLSRDFPESAYIVGPTISRISAATREQTQGEG